MKFDLRDRKKFPIIFVIGCIAVLVLSFFLSGSERLPVTITLLTAIGGVTGFLYSRHSQELQLFRELFREFNERYDDLNEKLNEIRCRPEGEPLNDTDISTLYDYFNLCAEEHMYFTAGCIDARVWRAWRNGMRYFADDPEIHALWHRELQSDSYYGLSLDFNRNG